MSYQLIQGDCVEVMRTLPAASCQVCVTSPPYFGLRDYQTATREGGDATCQHSTGNQVNMTKDNGTNRDGIYSSGVRPGSDNTHCRKCGARRIDQQIGLEETPDAYVAKLVDVFREVRRLLRDDGTLWLNLGDSYAGSGMGWQKNEEGSIPRRWLTDYQKNQPPGYISSRQPNGIKPKDLFGIPWMVAFALRADGWWLRSEIIWHKRAPMPESVTDRPTKAHEQVFLLTKSQTYFYDAEAIAEPVTGNAHGGAAQSSIYGAKNAQNGGKESSGLGKDWTEPTRNKRSVWTLGPESFAGAHFATMPQKLVEPCILAGSKVGDTVLDPFNGSGTTGAVALKHHRNYVGIDLNPDYIELAHDRIGKSQPMLLQVPA